MANLLAAFSVQQIILFVVLGALAFKGVIDFLMWCKDLYNKKFNKDYDKKKQVETLENHYNHCIEQHQESIRLYTSLENKIDSWTQSVDAKFNKIEEQLELLKTSDMHDIKGWIVEKHHNLTKQGWVDDFTMDTIEYRYSDYKAEHGNSYIDSLMAELRQLPKIPPDKIKEE